MDITATRVWEQLQHHCREISTSNMAGMFETDPHRFDSFSLETCGLFLDYSRNQITSETLKLLFSLAEKSKLAEAKKKLFSGARINTTERRSVMHHALRRAVGESFKVDGMDVSSLVHRTLASMAECAAKIRSNQWLGYSGKPVTHVITLGTGGSYLGSKTVWEALRAYRSTALSMDFVATVDPAHLSHLLSSSNPENTLFIIVSKSFKTPETLVNSDMARQWLIDHGVPRESLESHLIAVTANTNAAMEFGIGETNIFPLWDWVGGRFSLWSSVGLPLVIGLGDATFKSLLAGARAMDLHFEQADPPVNMPILLALLSIWNNNFLGAESHAILPYNHALRLLPAYLQQLEMESNGKSVTKDGKRVNTSTASIIWGSEGTNGQHAFHQLLHQGSRIVSVDFILPLYDDSGYEVQHSQLVANCLAQSQILMRGHTEVEIVDELTAGGMSEGEAIKLAPHKVIRGNKPSNTILMDQLTPESLGALIALYEHKIFCEGVIWHINSFDQWGVELGKILGEKIYQQMQNPDQLNPTSDSSTRGLLERYSRTRKLT